MLKVNNVVKRNMKNETNQFFQTMAYFLGNINFGHETSVNELIALYVRKSTIVKTNPATDDLGNAYLSAAILIAFFERITTPFCKPSSIQEILDTEEFTTGDMIAECTGIVAKEIFECNSERADEYLLYLALLVKVLLEEEDCCNPNDASGSDVPDTLSEAAKDILAKIRRKVNK